MVAWYLQHERRCVPFPPGRGSDMYQFGIPSSMTEIVKLLEAAAERAAAERAATERFAGEWAAAEVNAAAERAAAERAAAVRATAEWATAEWATAPVEKTEGAAAVEKAVAVEKVIEKAQRAVAVEYHTYWGFDSFVGLPEEADGALRPTDHVWGVGQFSLAAAYHARSITRDAHGAEQYALPPGFKQPSAEAMRSLYSGWYKAHNRVRLVAGYYNESLTARLAAQVQSPPAPWPQRAPLRPTTLPRSERAVVLSQLRAAAHATRTRQHLQVA